MKITKELLQRHSLGICSEEEKRAVEEWFKIKEDVYAGLSMVKDQEINEKRIWSKLGVLLSLVWVCDLCIKLLEL
ncbi:MAG: hypothetical protein AAGI25_21245 [Bacteroidota bacterium]